MALSPKSEMSHRNERDGSDCRRRRMPFDRPSMRISHFPLCCLQMDGLGLLQKKREEGFVELKVGEFAGEHLCYLR